MGRIGVAFRAFFRALFSADDARRIDAALRGVELRKLDDEAKTPRPAAAAGATKAEPPRRSDAITLLAALQREARLLDLVKEPLTNYTDEQIGAAARNVLRDAAAVVDRFFSLKRVLPQNEGESVEIAATYDAARYRLVGNVATGPYRGTLTHAGWEATTVNLPAWTGSKESALVIAPAEIEVGSGQ